MYPEALNKLTGGHCADCHLRLPACLCEAWRALPKVESGAAFFLLAHPRELYRPTNTGHILLTALADCQYATWSRTEIHQSLASLLNSSPCQPCLVFPDLPGHEPAITIEPAVNGLCAATRRIFILLDGTWQEARKMLRQSPYLQALPRVALTPEGGSDYHLRRNQAAAGLATVEVASQLLTSLGEPRSSQVLQDYFRVFQQHYTASRSNHSVAKVIGCG